MRYLTMAADYTGSCLRDDFTGPIELTSLDLPQEFIEEIISWHCLYRKIIPLSEEQREKIMNEIDTLDAQGLKITEKLKTLIYGGAKIRYYSEGRLKYLW